MGLNLHKKINREQPAKNTVKLKAKKSIVK